MDRCFFFPFGRSPVIFGAINLDEFDHGMMLPVDKSYFQVSGLL